MRIDIPFGQPYNQKESRLEWERKDGTSSEYLPNGTAFGALQTLERRAAGTVVGSNCVVLYSATS